MLPKTNNHRALRIMGAAKQEFGVHGLSGARIDRIARRAGVNKQLLFYYFHSKRGLYQATVASCIQDLERALSLLAPSVQGNQPVLSRLEQMLDAMYAFFESNRTLVELLTGANAPALRAFGPAIDRLVILLAEGQGVGEVKDDIDPHITAAQALVLMLAYIRMEPLIALSAAPLGVDGSSLSGRWKEAAIRLVGEGVAAR